MQLAGLRSMARAQARPACLGLGARTAGTAWVGPCQARAGKGKARFSNATAKIALAGVFCSFLKKSSQRLFFGNFFAIHPQQLF